MVRPGVGAADLSVQVLRNWKVPAPHWQDSCTWLQSGRSYGGHGRWWPWLWSLASGGQALTWNVAHGKGSSDVTQLVMGFWGLQQVWVTSFLSFRPIPRPLKQPAKPLNAAPLPKERGNQTDSLPWAYASFNVLSWKLPIPEEKQGKEEAAKARKRPGASALCQPRVKTSLQEIGWPNWRPGILRPSGAYDPAAITWGPCLAWALQEIQSWTRFSPSSLHAEG